MKSNSKSKQQEKKTRKERHFRERHDHTHKNSKGTSKWISTAEQEQRILGNSPKEYADRA
jgi:hypothetical protein